MARRRPSRSKLALRWIGAAILVVIALSYIHPLTSYRHARQEVRGRQAEARRLGLVREGEHLFIVKGVGTSEERAVP